MIPYSKVKKETPKVIPKVTPKVTVIFGGQYGDEGKGKVVTYLCSKQKFDLCCKFNGGPNAGHTFYLNGKKIVTHQVPSGVVYGIICIIGPNCVVDVEKLKKEIEELNKHFPGGVEHLILISKKAHIITEKHKKEDEENDVVGTTKCGIAPCYRDKHSRDGIRVGDVAVDGYLAGCKVIDEREYIRMIQPQYIICEGAQADRLDINSTNYPYVTSSECIASVACSIGFPASCITEIWCVAKIYRTYVGKKVFGNQDDPIMIQIQKLGHEFGSTTGRPRKCDWFDIDEMIDTAYANGATHLVINKCDILQELGECKYYENDMLHTKDSLDELKNHIEQTLMREVPFLKKVYFSYSAETI